MGFGVCGAEEADGGNACGYGKIKRARVPAHGQLNAGKEGRHPLEVQGADEVRRAAFGQLKGDFARHPIPVEPPRFPFGSLREVDAITPPTTPRGRARRIDMGIVQLS